MQIYLPNIYRLSVLEMMVITSLSHKTFSYMRCSRARKAVGGYNWCCSCWDTNECARM